jgi:hypothetical protein
MKQLVLIHGRSQQNLDSIALKQEWVGSLNIGLAGIGRRLPISPDNIKFPYYGNTLIQLCNGLTPEQAASVVIRGEITDDAERQFAGQIIIQAARSFGVTDDDARAAMDQTMIRKGIENWPLVLGFLRALDRIPGVSTDAIALATHDVFQYLSQSGISTIIDNGVAGAFTPDVETVVVSHSLGTLVAYNVLRSLGAAYKISQLITLGSPLAIPAVKQALAPLSHPSCLVKWANARDPHDVVALYPLTPDHFPLQPILDKSDVSNFTPNHHSIPGYLENPAVAQWIYDALS